MVIHAPPCTPSKHVFYMAMYWLNGDAGLTQCKQGLRGEAHNPPC